MNSDCPLPDTWVECHLGEVVEYGSALKVEPEEIPPGAWVLELEDIEKDTSKLLQRLTSAERQSKSTKTQFREGDVLYGKLRPYLNKVLRADQDGYCTTEIIPITPSNIVVRDYLFYSLKRPAFVQYADAASHGLSMPRLGTEAGKNAPFILAPLREQARISKKLEVLIGRADACRERIDRVPGLIARFRQAVVGAATTGELTADWRVTQSESSAPETIWERRSLADLCLAGRTISYGVIKLGRDVPDGVPCLRTSNVRWLRVETEGMKRISPSLSSDHSRTILKGGEVLVNVRGTLGGVAVASRDMIGWNVSREVAVIPADPAVVDPFYLAYWIGSARSQRWLNRVERGVAYVGINLEDLRQLPVDLPPVQEQQEIVRRVEGLFGYSDRLEIRYWAARSAVEQITPASIAKAFRGELVPNDPNDEPANLLLERFHQERSVEPVRTRRLQRRSRLKMKKLTNESVRKVISEMPEHFTFEELRSRIPGNYDVLTEIIFKLLREPQPLIKQVFDPESGAMRFVGVGV